MSSKVKQLRLPDLILRRKAPFSFRLILAAFGIALNLFFRRIETVNAGRVPGKGGLIFVLNHPNGLIDPALVRDLAGIEDTLEANIPRGAAALGAAIQEYRQHITFYKRT